MQTEWLRLMVRYPLMVLVEQGRLSQEGGETWASRRGRCGGC
jgi:hypothetical protein